MPAAGRQAAPLEGLTGANFINEDEKQIPRYARNDRWETFSSGCLQAGRRFKP